MIFVVQGIRAARVNLLMNDLAAGLPSPLAFLGLTEAITRDLGLAPWTGKVIPVLHEVSVSGGRTRPEMKPDGRKFVPDEIAEDLTGTVDLSLVIDIPGCESDKDLAGSLASKRVAGGIIQGGFKVRDVAGDGRAFREIARRGDAMIAPRPELCLTSNGLGPGYDRVLDILFPDKREPGSGWIVPVAAGYRLLEDPDRTPRRAGSRDRSIPHAFAEPLLGLAELVSIRNPRLTELAGEEFPGAFWSWCSRGDLVVGHPAYLSAATEENIDHG